MTRSCFPCTACCQGWLPADINEHKMYPGKPCPHCTATGCGIYENRPETPCRKFQCGWVKDNSPLPEKMKPSISGVIVLFDRGWNRQIATRAIPTGTRIPAETLKWLMDFARHTKIPLLYSERLIRDGEYAGIKNLGFGAPAFIQAVKDAIGPDDVMRLDAPQKPATE